MRDANEVLRDTGRLDPYDGVNFKTGISTGAGKQAVEENWNEPIAFSTLEVPSFPLGSLPEPVREFVSSVAVATQTPLDMPAMFALAALATSCAGRVELRLKDDWVEPANLFVAVAMPPASRKSAVCKLVFEPVYEFERELLAATGGERAQAEATADVLRQRVAEAKKSLAAQSKREQREANEQELADLVDQLHHHRVPPLPRLVVDDATPEIVATLLHEQGGSLAVISAEGGGLFELMSGRYSKNGGPNFEVFLKGHAGDQLRVDRMNGQSFTVPDPALTLGLAIQPSVLEELVKRGDFRGRGLLGRILFVIPISTLGKRRIDPPSVPLSVRESYHERITALCSLKESVGPPKDLRLSDAARSLLLGYAEEIEPELGTGGSLDSISDWAGKLVGTIGRVATLLHMASHESPCQAEEEIQASTVRDAIAIGRYLLGHAMAAFSSMRLDSDERQAQRLLAWIRRHDKVQFSHRDAFSGLRSNDIQRSSDLNRPIEILVERHYLRAFDDPEPKGRGRPSKSYDVNPLTHNTQ